MPFVRICLHATYSNKIKGNEGNTNFLASSLSRTAQLSVLGGEVCHD
jgi:hypothetical protein